MKILVLGAGAIGVYLGTLLNSKGNDVTLVGRKKLKKLHETLLIDDSSYTLPKRAYKLPNHKNYDIIFVTSKLYDLENNLESINTHKLSSKYLVSIQNGLVDNSLYEKYIHSFKFCTVSVFEGFRLLENQLFISKSETGWKTDNTQSGKEIALLLKHSGINCATAKDLDQIKAEKTVMNCSVNLLSAVEKKTFYELCKNKETAKTIDTLFNETYDIINKKVKMRPKEELRKLLYSTISNMRHYSSTYQDAVSKHKTEVDFLNGFVSNLGKEVNILTPYNNHLLEEFKKKYK
ncbi:MAG: 2-dehydropantoate 2-reductase [Candidatus Woesearchaeota archaeon]|jgi:2-dehydropantoate 2-reductase